MTAQRLKTLAIFALGLALVPALGAADDGSAAPTYGSQVPTGFERIVAFASDGLRLGAAVHVISGDLVANGGDGGLVHLGAGTTTPAGFTIRGDRVEIEEGARVDGELFTNALSAAGQAAVPSAVPLSLPVFAELPPFHTAAPGAVARDVLVPRGGEVNLPPGHYLALRLDGDARAVFSGGTYHFDSIVGGGRSALVFAGPSEVRVASRLELGPRSTIAASDSSTLPARDLLLYVDSDRDAAPQPVLLGAASRLGATLYAPRASVTLGPRTRVVGAVAARDVTIGGGSLLSLASALREEPPPTGPDPVADPQNVLTHGQEPLSIVLTGHDAEGQDLAFFIVTPPRQGKIDAPEPIIPDPIFDPNRGKEVQPPVTSALLNYFPLTPDDLEDTLTFAVKDAEGNVAEADVTINSQQVESPPPSKSVDALDVGTVTHQDTPVTVTLRGNAPDGVDLTFDLVDKPFFGDIGKLIQGDEKPRRTAQIDYRPQAGHLGPDSFSFVACGPIGGRVVCDQASASIETIPDPDSLFMPAYNQQLATRNDIAVEIHLTGDSRNEKEIVAFTLLQLPRSGLLFDSRGNVIRETPFLLADGILTYRPEKGFVGNDAIVFQGDDGLGAVIAQVDLQIVFGSCQESLAFCNDGRGQ